MASCFDSGSATVRFTSWILEPVLWGPVFQPVISDPEFFRQVKVDHELGTIVWPDGADLDPDVLYARATGAYEEPMAAGQESEETGGTATA